nr:MAG TPA: hypothetical protein [Caudoviricetes sp.]
MDMIVNASNELTPSEVYGVLHDLGYYWSNETQCYYSSNFELPLLTDAQAIMENM